MPRQRNNCRQFSLIERRWQQRERGNARYFLAQFLVYNPRGYDDGWWQR
jgi:hypothetical protein